MEQNMEPNEKYLKNGLFYMGFTQELYPALTEKMKEGNPEFTLNESRKFNDIDKAFEYKLQYGPSADGRYPYEWKGYDVALKEDPSHKMHVDVTGNRGITAKEAANLLSGLAVGKSVRNGGVERETWTVLDLEQKDDKKNFVIKTFGENYGFDMKAALKELVPQMNEGKPLSNDDVVALRKGNLPEISFNYEGKQYSAFLVAKPEERKVEVYTNDGKLLKAQEGLSQQQIDRQERLANAPKKADFIQKNLLSKIPRNAVPALAETGEEVKKGRKR